MNFPFVLPMGTIVTACMIFGIIVALNPFPINKLPAFIRKMVGWILLAAGIWNSFWHGVRHIAEFWGYSAFASGILMILAALLILAPSKLPTGIKRSKPLILILLTMFATMYAVTIYRL